MGLDDGIRAAARNPCPVCCVSAVSFTLFMLLVTSWKTLGPYKYGLLKNSVTGKVKLDEVYEPGVHMIGFWNNFLSFPSTIQTIQYSFEKPEEGVQHLTPLHLRSMDAVPIHLEVSVQYQRKKDELPDLFEQAMTSTLQENIFISNLRAELTKVMSRHDVSDCWEHRETLVQEFMRACEEVLAKSHALCWGLQFYRVEVDERYERELVVTQVQKQRRRIEAARKRAAEVRSETQVRLANYSSRIRVVEAEAGADRYQLEAAAWTAAEVARVSAQAAAMEHVREALRLPNGSTLTEAQMAEYQRAMALGSVLKTPRLFYGLSSPPTYVAMSSAASRRLEGSVESHWPPPWLEADVQSQLPSPESSGPSRGPPPWKEPSHEAHIVSHEPLLEL
uniref:Band 7 domain-containing protein n=1 Tax=Pyrodinium bahamense TaxID=73915 RepID=A0A7S0AYA4_9DINO